MADVAEPVLVTTDGAVTTLTLNRPDVLNALTPELVEQLGDALEQVRDDPGVRVVVLTGAGRAFSAGVDLKALAGNPLERGEVGDGLDIPGRRALDLLTTIPKVVVGKVNGHCFTGALELLLGCDLIVAADEATFGDTHAKWGLRPSWGMSQRLIRLVGVSRARELSFTARTFTGTEAATWGLAMRSVPRAELDQFVDQLVETLLANSTGVLAAYKDLYRQALEGGLTDGLRYEADTHYDVRDTWDRLGGFG